MKFKDIVTFRDDLLFNGAVQIGWLEHDPTRAEKAASHYVFHGPGYHGVSGEDYDGSFKPVDTASFTVDILRRIHNGEADDPIELAIAGYGTGKSHLGVTLTCLCSQPQSSVAKEILRNMAMADNSIGLEAQNLLKDMQPFLVVALNGMQDFDLNSEIIRQILKTLHQEGIDTSILEDLRPRFKTAQVFTESFYKSLENDYQERFGEDKDFDSIIEALKEQDENTFRQISAIYEQKMGMPIHAVGQESLHDFIRVAKDSFCGPKKPFAGILIIFDEFGRYMEFSVQKPHIAGSGALQQLFECVQANGERVFLLGFIQYELKAYISRMAPERRDDLNRYVTRYDVVNKVRLSTNLETLIASLLEKHDHSQLESQIKSISGIDEIQKSMLEWFPDLKNHSLWTDKERFRKTIIEGCWPLHPISTWVLYKLSSVGKFLQQRSAFSLLAEVYNDLSGKKIEPGGLLNPIDLCNQSLVDEFLAAEQYGQQGAVANAYEAVVAKYEYQLSDEEKMLLKAVLLANKIGTKVESKTDYFDLFAHFFGLKSGSVSEAALSLEKEYGVLEWNEQLNQYEIVGDAVPRRTFLDYLERKAALIDADQRANIFVQNYIKWGGRGLYNTDFGVKNDITTREWDYKIQYSNVAMIKMHIDYAVKIWLEARETDKPRGQLIYCYVGPESNFDDVSKIVKGALHNSLSQNNIEWQLGAPVAVLLLHDEKGLLGQRVAEYWAIEEMTNAEERDKFRSFIIDKTNSIRQDLENYISNMERDRHLLVATSIKIKSERLINMLYQIFDKIYPERVEFPFDGFSTARGNAAKDCQVFTRQLFLGYLDRNWLMTQAAQQKNRGDKVLEKAWGIFDKDGSLKIKPTNKSLRGIIDILEEKLQPIREGGNFLNFGFAIRLLCSPPYGFNIASAGLVLAYFIGKRRHDLSLIYDQQQVSVENWLPDVLQGNFLNLAILDKTYAEVVSQETISEWERLLEDWDTTDVFVSKIDFHNQAIKLQSKIPIPQMLYYKYENLVNKTGIAQAKINEYNNNFEDAINKIHNGMERDRLNILAWGASILKKQLTTMELEPANWTQIQIKKIQDNYVDARIKTQQIFPNWYIQQKTNSIESIGDFKRRMASVERNLTELDLDEEQKLLSEHVKNVEENVRLIEELRQTKVKIKQMIANSVINDSTSMETLKSWLDQIQIYAQRLAERRMKTILVDRDVAESKKMLAHFQHRCSEQVELNKERLVKIYDMDEIGNLGQILGWKQEVTKLMSIFAGDKNAEDLMLVQKQLDLLERHFNILDDTELFNYEFQSLLKQFEQDNDASFEEDDPPLDNGVIYASIGATLRAKRWGLSIIWMEKHVPDMEEVKKYDAVKAIQTINSLQNHPKLLMEDQVANVNQIIEACGKRLDELEIDGLLAKFEVLSDENKKAFLSKIKKQIKIYINDIA